MGLLGGGCKDEEDRANEVILIIMMICSSLYGWETNTHRAIAKTVNKAEATRTVKVLMDINVHCKVVGLRCDELVDMFNKIKLG